MTTTPTAAGQVLDRLDPTGPGLRIFCEVYAALHARGMSHDAIAERLQYVDPVILTTGDGQVRDDLIMSMIETWAPPDRLAERTAAEQQDHELVAISLVEAALSGDPSALGLIPDETGPAGAALIGALAAVAGFALTTLTPGSELRFLTALRHRLVLTTDTTPEES